MHRGSCGCELTDGEGTSITYLESKNLHTASKNDTLCNIPLSTLATSYVCDKCYKWFNKNFHLMTNDEINQWHNVEMTTEERIKFLETLT